jgi:PST family polysaccharide transporter
MNIRKLAAIEFKHLFVYKNTKVLENFLALSSVQIANYLLPLVTVPYLTRTIGLEYLGLLAFAQSLISYFVTFTDYGFNISATRRIAVERENDTKVSEIFTSVLLVKACLMLISAIVLCGLLLSFPRLRNNWYIFLLYFGDVLGNVLFPVWFFQGMQRMKYITFINLLSRVIFTLSVFAVVRGAEDYFYVPAMSLMGSLVTGFISLLIVFRKFRIKLRLPDSREIIYQLKEGWHVFISTVAISSYTTTRLFAVGALTNNTVTGHYVIAERLMNVIQMFPLVSLLSALYPMLSETYVRDPDKSLEIAKKLQRFTTIIYLIFLPIVFVLAPLIVKLFAGAAYQETVTSFRLLLVAVFFINANAFRVQFLLVSTRGKTYARIHSIAGVAGVILTLACTYYFSFIGTGIAIIVTALFVLLLTIKNEPQGELA